MNQKRPQRDRRTEILEIAGALFLEHGYQGTSMSQIAAAVGGSKGTLYAYFENKEALFAANMEMRVRARGAEVFDLPDHADNPEEMLALLGRRYLRLITEADSVAMLRLLYHESPRFPEIGRIFHDTCILRGRRMLTDYLSRLHARGVLDVPDPGLAAEQFLMLCQTNLVMPVMLCVRQGISEEEADKVVSSAVTMFMAAYRKRAA